MSSFANGLRGETAAQLFRPRSEEHTSELQSHSDLHSFPTRRSSDLDELRDDECRFPDTVKQIVVRLQRPQSLDDLGSELSGFACQNHVHEIFPLGCRRSQMGCVAKRPLSFSGQDRKSTRLNSSHTVIYTLSLHDALPILTSSATTNVAFLTP